MISVALYCAWDDSHRTSLTTCTFKGTCQLFQMAISILRLNSAKTKHCSKTKLKNKRYDCLSALWVTGEVFSIPVVAKERDSHLVGPVPGHHEPPGSVGLA